VLDHDKLKRDRPDRDAHARQRHRHQLLRGQQGAQLNLKHRPVGLGIMGFQDCLHLMRVPYASADAVEFADRSMEAVCYHAYWASTELAAERGRYASFKGSLWDRGILPQDSLKLLAEQRGGYVEVDDSSDDGLGCAARPHRAARHAQLQLHRDRADRDHLQHHRRGRVHRADLPEPVRQIEPVGRLHGGQRLPGARPEEARPVGRGDGRRPEVLRRQPVADRPHPVRAAKAIYATAFEVDRRGSSSARRAARSGSTRRSR
jgi:hypothetical protein